jgi:hypothetical protein
MATIDTLQERKAVHFSLNTEVSSILTNEGLAILEAYYASDAIHAESLRTIHRVSSEGSCFALWEIFTIFGEALFPGNKRIFMNDMLTTIGDDPVIFTVNDRVEVSLAEGGLEILEAYHKRLYPQENIFPFALFQRLHYGGKANWLWFPFGELAHVFRGTVGPEHSTPFINKELVLYPSPKDA